MKLNSFNPSILREIYNLYNEIYEEIFGKNFKKVDKILYGPNYYLLNFKNFYNFIKKHINKNIFIFFIPKKAYLIAFLKNNRILIDEIGVKKEFRGKGYGSQLMRELFEFAKQIKVKEIFLETYKENIPFFEKFGFKLIKETDSYMGKKFFLLKLEFVYL